MEVGDEPGCVFKDDRAEKVCDHVLHVFRFPTKSQSWVLSTAKAELYPRPSSFKCTNVTVKVAAQMSPFWKQLMRDLFYFSTVKMPIVAHPL